MIQCMYNMYTYVPSRAWPVNRGGALAIYTYMYMYIYMSQKKLESGYNRLSTAVTDEMPYPMTETKLSYELF